VKSAAWLEIITYENLGRPSRPSDWSVMSGTDASGFRSWQRAVSQPQRAVGGSGGPLRGLRIRGFGVRVPPNAPESLPRQPCHEVEIPNVEATLGRRGCAGYRAGRIVALAGTATSAFVTCVV